MQVLVTGCAGFLGFHLSQSLLRKNLRVVGLDNLSTGSNQAIQALQQSANFQFIQADITQPLPAMPPLHSIYNLACPASPPHYQKDPVQTFKTSILGAMNLLELARKNNCRILQASTSEVYGDPEQHPQSESYWGHVNPIGIRACYDEGKRGAETLFFDYHRQYALPIKVVRIFNTYGPYMHPNDGRVVSNFIVQALRGDALTIYGDGTQTRSFCYVDDLIRGIESMMESADEVTGPVNLGNPNEFTMLQLAEKVKKLTGSSSQIVMKPLPLDDPKQRRPDIALAQKILAWQPQIELEDGLRRTIDYFSTLVSAHAKVKHG